MKIDGFAIPIKKTPPVTKAATTKYLVELITDADLVHALFLNKLQDTQYFAPVFSFCQTAKLPTVLPLS